MQAGPVTTTHVQKTQSPEKEGRRQKKKYAGDNPSTNTVKPPPEVGGELLSLRARQEHAELQGSEELGLTDPSPLLHHLRLEDCDLSGGSSEPNAADLQPKPNGFSEGRLAWIGTFHGHVL